MNKPSFERVRQAMPRVAGVLSPVVLALRGKKTYLGAGLAAALAAYYLSTGESDRAVELIALALGLGGLRGAVGRAIEKPLVVLDNSGEKLARDEAYDRHLAEVLSRLDPPSERHETRDTRHETGKPAPDRTLARDLARFEDEGGPPMDERKARLEGEGFLTIPEARKRAGLDRPGEPP